MSYKKNIVIGTSISCLVVLIAVSTYFISLGTCPSGSFPCDNGTVCLPQKLICNFHRDCKDGSDENPTDCGNFHGETNEMSWALETADQKKKNLSHPTQNYYFDSCALDRSLIPSKCGCGQFTWIVCAKRNFTRMPQSLPRNMTGLIVTSNQISIKDEDTLDYPKLRYLRMDYNNISVVPTGIFSKMRELRKLFLHDNQIVELSRGCFTGLVSLRWLFLDNNKLRDFDLIELEPLVNIKWINMSTNFLTLQNNRFPSLPNLTELFLDKNLIENIDSETFQNLPDLKLLSIRSNKIQVLDSEVIFISQLKELRLSDNPISEVADDAFANFYQLDALYLDDIPAKLSYEFFKNIKVSHLSVQGLTAEQLNFKGISEIPNLIYVVYEQFSFCTETPNAKKCRPNTDGVSSLSDLLSNPSLRYAAWFMMLLTCMGNGLVLWGRFKSRDENRSVSVVIRNLAVADLLMGLYLLIIGIQDLRYRNVYQKNSHEWMQSWECTLAGILAMISSEVSMFILAFMSIERFLLIADPFGGHRHLNSQNILMSLFVIWMVGLAIAIMPVILWRSSTKFYGTLSGTCFPLFIQERFSVGWQYSAFVFLGINLVLLLLISSLYSALLFSIWKTRRATPLNIFDYEFAVRFFFIVLTDSACWVPIIALKVMVFVDFEISADVYAWLVVFILPLNSAVNPLLYTFTTPKYRDQIFANLYRGSASKRRERYGNSTQESQESNGKIIPLLTEISTWKI